MSSPPKAPQIVMIGLEPIPRGVLERAAKGMPVDEWAYDLEKLSDMPIVEGLRIIVCGPPAPEVNLNEVAQFLRMQYPDASILYMTTVRTGFVRKDYVKNGFNDAFLIPLDTPTFEEAFKTALAKAGHGKAYRSVKLVDIQPDQALGFDTFIYFPMNGKHIKYSAAGDAIDAERAKKLAQHKMSNLHINAEDTKKFYQWTAQQLANLGKSETMSVTEKRDRMQAAVRELISDMFTDQTSDASFERGKEVVQDCQEIVKAYIMVSDPGENKDGNSWYEKLLELSEGENTVYAHASHVATFAAMFSMALGVGKPENLAMAGLLHDIGLSEVPAETQAKPESERTPEEQADYQKHPKISVHLIQTRKMVVPKIVLEMVAQHHERFDGTGYPDALSGPKLKKESQVLAIANDLCYMIAPSEGKPAITPFQAIQKMYDEIPAGEKGHKYDPELVRKLYELFKPKT